jgi:hypothetical protein
MNTRTRNWSLAVTNTHVVRAQAISRRSARKPNARSADLCSPTLSLRVSPPALALACHLHGRSVPPQARPRAAAAPAQPLLQEDHAETLAVADQKNQKIPKTSSERTAGRKSKVAAVTAEGVADCPSDSLRYELNRVENCGSNYRVELYVSLIEQ